MAKMFYKGVAVILTLFGAGCGSHSMAPDSGNNDTILWDTIICEYGVFPPAPYVPQDNPGLAEIDEDLNSNEDQSQN